MGIEIDFLPVGDAACSGDAICVRYGNDLGGYTVHVVDGGFTSTTDSIIEHLNRHYAPLQQIDHVVVTHADGDHAAGLIDLLENFRVGALWMNRPWLYAADIIDHFHGNWTLEGLIAHFRDSCDKLVRLEEIAQRKRIPIYAALQGAQIGAFHVVAPSRERYISLLPKLDLSPKTYTKIALDWFTEAVQKAASLIRETWTGETLSDNPPATSASNETSVVQVANIGGHKIVLTGDVGPAGLSEAALYAQNLDMLQPHFIQIPHHGSRRNVTPSTLDSWLGTPLRDGTIQRGSAFCSAANDDPDHPRGKVVNAFTRRGYAVFVTKGQIISHRGGGVPPRDGWSNLTPMPFQSQVEE
jgi:beta-lactamase superfamily II metal-dependent hydrolase